MEIENTVYTEFFSMPVRPTPRAASGEGYSAHCLKLFPDVQTAEFADTDTGGIKESDLSFVFR